MDGERIDIAAARQTAADGLRLCLAGDDQAGLALYRSITEPRALAVVPLGLHVHLLRDAARGDAAEALQRMTIAQGGDLAWKAMRDGVSPETAAAEYERFIALGQANALMINRYIALLTRLGRTDDVAAIFDPARLLHRVRISGGDAAARALLDREMEVEIESRMSVREMRKISGLKHFPEFAALHDTLRAETQAYYARWAASDHLLAPLVPADFTIGPWGLISRGEGYNARHNHPRGWMTGIFYPAGLPADIAGGSLCIGGWRDPAPPGWPVAEIRPEAGLLVLMPSYYVHWTLPLGAPGLRLSIAFDARSV
jgi:hypothetical protein